MYKYFKLQICNRYISGPSSQCTKNNEHLSSRYMAQFSEGLQVGERLVRELPELVKAQLCLQRFEVCVARRKQTRVELLLVILRAVRLLI